MQKMLDKYNTHPFKSNCDTFIIQYIHTCVCDAYYYFITLYIKHTLNYTF